MDRMSDSGSDDGGSNPFGNTRGALFEVPLFYFPVLPTNSTTYLTFLHRFLQNMVCETGEAS